LRVGIVGTGFAARLRAESLRADGRADLVAVAGHTLARTKEFASEFEAVAVESWSELLHNSRQDVVFISTINRDHAAITRAALGLGIHVVVEYPLAFDLEDARSLVTLAQQRKLMLHVEHIELLSGIHLLLKKELPGLGSIFSASYTTLTVARPAPDRWTYKPALFGFPFIGAVSRIHRLVDLFGPVRQVSCQVRYDGLALPECYSSCYCAAQLTFESGLIVPLTYGKGESIWRSQRTIEAHGQKGALLIDGEQAILVRSDGAHPLDCGSRRGLFEQDTRLVLEHLLQDQPLYVKSDQMLHALAVGVAAQKAAETHQIVFLDEKMSADLSQSQLSRPQDGQGNR
jgi:biliverdin reductase